MALILMYHRIASEESDPWSLCVTPEHFSEQLEIVKKLGTPCSVDQLVNNLNAGISNKNLIAISFDDGFKDNLYQGQSILEAHDVPATIFLVTEYFSRNQEFWFEELEGLLLTPGNLPRDLRIAIGGEEIAWDLGESAEYTQDSFWQNRNWKAMEQSPSMRHSLYYELWKRMRPLKDIERRTILDELWIWTSNTKQVRPQHCALSTEEVRQLAKDGIFEIGSHTKTHPQLSSLEYTEQMDEISGSKTFLEELIGRPVNSFAYPYGWHGDYSNITVNCVREVGYKSACTTVAGGVSYETDRFQLNRVAVADWNGEEFEQQMLSYLR